MAGTTNETTEELKARLERLDAEIKLRDRIAQLEERVRRGPGMGSPAAMTVKEPPRPIFGGGGGGGGGGLPPGLREEFIRTGGYEKM